MLISGASRRRSSSFKVRGKKYFHEKFPQIEATDSGEIRSIQNLNEPHQKYH
jgi:hypothetical protein